MKKIIAVIISASMFILMCGCSGAVEVNNRMFVQVLGIDKKDDLYEVYAKVYDSGDTQNQGVSSFTGKGKTLLSAIAAVESSQNRKIFLGHSKVIVLGQGIDNPSKELKAFLDGSVSPSCFVVYSEDIKKITDKNLSDKWTSEYILSNMENKYNHGELVYTTLADIISAKNAYFMPVIKVSDKKFDFSGIRIKNFQDNSVMLDSEQVLGVKILKNDFSFDDSIMIPLTINSHTAGILITKIKTCTRTAQEDGTLNYNVTITLEADVKENISDIPDNVINTAAQNYIQGVCYDAFDTCITKNQCDILNIRKLVTKYSGESIDLYNNNVSDILPNITVDAKISSVL